MMKIVKTLIATLALLLSMAAFALDLDAAKSQGMVGEQPVVFL